MINNKTNMIVGKKVLGGGEGEYRPRKKMHGKKITGETKLSDKTQFLTYIHLILPLVMPRTIQR